jgi:pimeloyl-ACP methyl ester carboxylesterase
MVNGRRKMWHPKTLNSVESHHVYISVFLFHCRYSIEHAVQDLKELVEALQLNKFHLLGHSFGGIIAFEYSSKADDDKCLSLTLDSTPSNMQMSLDVGYDG